MRTCIRIMAATPNLESVTRDTVTTGRTHASTLHLGRKYKHPLVFITHETDPEYEWRHKHGGSKRHKDHSDCTHEQGIQIVLKVSWFGPFTMCTTIRFAPNRKGPKIHVARTNHLTDQYMLNWSYPEDLHSIVSKLMRKECTGQLCKFQFQTSWILLCFSASTELNKSPIND